MTCYYDVHFYLVLLCLIVTKVHFNYKQGDLICLMFEIGSYYIIRINHYLFHGFRIVVRYIYFFSMVNVMIVIFLILKLSFINYAIIILINDVDNFIKHNKILVERYYLIFSSIYNIMVDFYYFNHNIVF